MPGGFTGNGSVEWFVNADNPKRAPVNKKDPKPGKPNRHHQSGVDDFGDDAYEFEVKIKIPKDANARAVLAKALSDAAGLTSVPAFTPGATIALTFPVEDKGHGGPTDNQILIDWRPMSTLV